MMDRRWKRTRRLIRAHFWGTLGANALPRAEPTNVETGVVVPAAPFFLYPVTSPALLDVERYTFVVGGDVQVYAYHFRSTTRSRKLAITHEGHSYFDLPDHHVHINRLLDLGWNVVAVQLPQVFIAPHPPNPPNGAAMVNHPVWAQPREATSIGYARTFLEPAIFAKGELVRRYGYETIVVMGLSGGGWATNMLAALDTDIRAAFSVAGSMPWAMRSYVARGDFEQIARDGYETVFETPSTARPYFRYLPREYHDLYAMGATDGRWLRQVYIEGDESGSFDPTGIHTEIDAWVADANARASGTVAVAYDTSQSVHKISAWTTERIVADLDALGLNALGPDEIDVQVAEPVIPNLIARYRGAGLTAAAMLDDSGNGNHLTAPVAVNRATLVELDAVLRQPALAFAPAGDGNDYYRNDAVLVGGAPPAAFGAYSVWGVVKQAAGTSGIILVGTDASGATFTGPTVYKTPTAGGTYEAATTAPGLITAVGASSEWQWFAWVWTPTTKRLYVNGILKSTINVADTCPAIRKLGVGWVLDAGGSASWSGRIAHLAIAGHALDAAQLAAIGDAFHSRFGL